MHFFAQPGIITLQAVNPQTEIGADMTEMLHRYFGYRTFRDKQEAIIRHTVQGGDSVVLMPTGGGKSICYQLPALMLDGFAVVVSPLIALMKDQVQSLQANGISAAFLNSTLTADEERRVLQQLAAGAIKLLYVSPERLLAPGFLDYLAERTVSLFAIDEAHCISSWGHQFRPDYQRLHVIRARFPDTPVMALTATADRAVRSDIGSLLRLAEPRMFVASFDRPNISLAVLPGQQKWEQLFRIVSRYRGESGIIYCSSRNATEKLAEKLADKGLRAAAYHAGLGTEARNRVQDAFIQGDVDIAVATIAFGMGIDKPDVRFVIHYHMPGNLEGYYQEIGRAGRDGAPAEAILFYSYRDVQTHLRFIGEIADAGFRQIQEAKLERMQAYAEAQVCRRKILLTYFSEFPEADCGHCDVCRDRPVWFDGTVEAQMALSAVTRSRETLTVSLLTDVLRGVRSRPVAEGGYDRIKTFGAGARVTAFAWNLFIQQMLQQGLLEIDYKDHYRLKTTPLSNVVLFEGRQVQLVSPDTIKERQKRQREKPVKKTEGVSAADQALYDRLSELRKSIASRTGKPPYVVFNNATLIDMTAIKPGSLEEFLEVSGVGEHKARKYGEKFLAEIRNYLQES